MRCTLREEAVSHQARYLEWKSSSEISAAQYAPILPGATGLRAGYRCQALAQKLRRIIWTFLQPEPHQPASKISTNPSRRECASCLSNGPTKSHDAALPAIKKASERSNASQSLDKPASGSLRTSVGKNQTNRSRFCVPNRTLVVGRKRRAGAICRDDLRRWWRLCMAVGERRKKRRTTPRRPHAAAGCSFAAKPRLSPAPFAASAAFRKIVEATRQSPSQFYSVRPVALNDRVANIGRSKASKPVSLPTSVSPPCLRPETS